MKFLKSTAALALAVLMLALCACGTKVEKVRDLLCDIDVDRVTAAGIDENESVALADAYLRIFGGVITEDKNSPLISPLSIITALGMLADGTAGNTRAQLEELFGLKTEELDALLSYLDARLRDTGSKNVKFTSANSLWLTNNGGIKFKTSYLERVKASYAAEIYSVNFADPTIPDEINSWVKKHTDGMIEKMIEPSDVDGNTVSAILNALTFDAKWEKEFEKVSDGTFASYTGDERNVSMMFSSDCRYYELDGAVGISKDYDGGKYRFEAILPDGKTDVFDFAKNLDGKTIMSLPEREVKTSVRVGVPKFSLDCDFDLIPALTSIGITDVFGGAADFSELAEIKPGEIYVDKAIHKTHIELDESGTKAAAATYISTRKNAVMYEKEVILDRPFLYMIVDAETNLPVFIGILTDVK